MPDENHNTGYDGDSAIDDSWTAEARGASDIVGARREAAADRALSNEELAAKSAKTFSGKNGAGTDAAKNAEGSATKAAADNIKNSVAGKAAAAAAGAAVPGGQIVAGKLKKMGPFGLILLLIGICMGVFSMSNTLAPFGLINNLMDSYNVLRTSMNTRSTTMMPKLIKGGLNTKIVKTSMFGKEKFHISLKMQKKLLNNGVYYDKELRILVYTDPETGKSHGISADESTKGKIPDSMDIVDASGETKHVEISTKNTYDDALKMNEGFFVANEKSTRTLKGQVAGWFDSISKRFHSRIGNSRNRQKNTSEGADDEEIIKHAKETGLDEEAGEVGDLQTDDPYEKKNSSTGKVETDKDGNPIIEHDYKDARKSDAIINTDGNDGKMTRKMAKAPDAEVNITKALTARAKTAAAAFGKASKGLSIGVFACAGFKILNTLISTVAALQKAQILNWGTGFFESIQKAQAGDSSTELMFYMNKMNLRDPESGKSAWETDAINQTFADGDVRVSADDPYAQQLNTTNMTSSLLSSGEGLLSGPVLEGLINFGGTVATYKKCVQLGLLGSVVGDLADVLGAVSSGGLSIIIKKLFDTFTTQVALGALVSGLAGFIISILVPKVAKMLATDLIGENVGPILGYATDDAANMYLGGQMQSASGTPGTDETVAAQYRQTQKVIASEARYIRDTHSPFDLSSKYTFLGSIVNSMTPLAMSLNSPLSLVTNTTSLVGSSISSLLPTADAAQIVGVETSLSHDCGSLSQLESGDGRYVCDAYGNPYFVTNMKTMDETFDKVMDNVALDPGGGRNFVDEAYEDHESGEDEDDNPKIRDRSDLAKFIVACAVRESNYGQEDSRVASYITGDNGTTFSTVTSTILNSAPVSGTIINGIELANVDWIIGENCGKEEYKYYARYLEDQRWLESAGIVEQSAVTAFLDDYYEKYPLDNSLEGVIARYSGQTKEDVELALGYLEYIAFLNEYDPSGAGPEEFEKKDSGYIYDGANIMAAYAMPEAIRPQTIIYDNLRDRISIA